MKNLKDILETKKMDLKSREKKLKDRALNLEFEKKASKKNNRQLTKKLTKKDKQIALLTSTVKKLKKQNQKNEKALKSKVSMLQKINES